MTARAEAAAATRERIARSALRLLLNDWYDDVTLAAIAQAAGVSHQTVLNNFGSKEGVVLAAVDFIHEETGDARSRAVPGDVPGAVRVLVGEYERIGDTNARWAAASERLGGIARVLDDARAGHQAWLEHIFGEWLPTRRAARRRAVNALHAATDVYTWKLLRRDLRLTRAEVEKTMTDLVSGVLAGLDRPAAAPRDPKETQ
jgi:AcrR family transcriptional regulator